MRLISDIRQLLLTVRSSRPLSATSHIIRSINPLIAKYQYVPMLLCSRVSDYLTDVEAGPTIPFSILLRAVCTKMIRLFIIGIKYEFTDTCPKALRVVSRMPAAAFLPKKLTPIFLGHVRLQKHQKNSNDSNEPRNPSKNSEKLLSLPKQM